MAAEPPIEVLGIGADGLDGLTAAQWQLLQTADPVAVSPRLLTELQQRLPGPSLLSTREPGPLLQALAAARRQGRRPLVLASGDPLWFGIGRRLAERFGAEALRVQPAASALQLAFARLARPWQDATWVSLHGRDEEALLAALARRPTALVVLTDAGAGGPTPVRQLLQTQGLSAAYELWLMERLGHPDERRWLLEAQDPLPPDLDPLHLLLLLARPPAPPEPAALPRFGLDDGLWLQHGDHPGLMTKREVRIQLLADLDLPDRGVLWDLGAGTGSVGLEALRLSPGLALWAVERRSGGADLIRANAERLGLQPAAVLEGEALALLPQLPDPDRVLIGGGRDRPRLLHEVLQRLKPGGVVVLPLATLEPLAGLRPLLDTAGLQISLTQLQISRGVPLAEGTRLAPLNPVLVLRGRRP
ncbi:MAG: precorrin-6y C5,15-methyltransferase (decarboxylating) subunit CbiE [Cyanobacteriota bacterium]